MDQLPRGRHGLPRTFVHDNQRSRILESLIAVCATKGYAPTTVEEVLVAAGISRRTFYDIFDDKEECFLAACDAVVDRLLELIAEAYAAAEGDWIARVSAALDALVDFVLAEPDQARVLIVDVLSAGRPALECRDATLREFADLLAPGPDDVPEHTLDVQVLTEAAVGGIYEALYAHIVNGETQRLRDLRPDLLYCAVVPLVGHATALVARNAKQPRPRPRRRRAS